MIHPSDASTTILPAYRGPARLALPINANAGRLLSLWRRVFGERPERVERTDESGSP